MSPSKLPESPGPAPAPPKAQGGGQYGPRAADPNTTDRGGAPPPSPLEQAFGSPEDAADTDARLAARSQFRRLMTQEDRELIYKAVADQAKGGHVSAAALLMAYDYGKPTQPAESKDTTPIRGAEIAASIEAALEAARRNGADTTDLERGLWEGHAIPG